MPIKDVFRRRAYDRERKRRQREEASRIKEINKLQKELNGILPVALATYGSYRLKFPQATYESYLRQLKRFKKLKQPKKKGFPVEFEVRKFPLDGDDCIKFRAMLSGFWIKDGLFCGDHDVKCESCNRWRINNKPLKAFNMWHTQKKKSLAEKRDETLNKQLNQEL